MDAVLFGIALSGLLWYFQGSSFTSMKVAFCTICYLIITPVIDFLWAKIFKS